METAKELAKRAFIANLTSPTKEHEEQFEGWWSIHYGNKYLPLFNPKQSVFIDGKRYIQAE